MFMLSPKWTLWVLILALSGTPQVWARHTPDKIGDYDLLLEYLGTRKLEAPLMLLADDDGVFDRQRHRDNLAHLNDNQSLLKQIQTRLRSDALDWKLAGSSRRILAVPEQRQAYAALFEHYCRQAVAYTLMRTQLPDPYRTIATLEEPIALAAHPAPQGVTAYLVHNIADEYIEEFVFFNQASQGPQLKITLSNRVFSGNIGSYSSRLTIGENGTYLWAHETYTLWQNNAQDPINVLVAPVEETLHIALRRATTEAIEVRLAQATPQSITDIQRVVDEWMAVEEAIVGGLVALLMPEIFDRLLSGPLESELARSLADRKDYPQYRYLQEGIRLVEQLGVLPAVALYQSQPFQFKHLITSTPKAVPRLSAPALESCAECAGDTEPSS